MKPKLLLILVAVLAVLGGIAYFASQTPGGDQTDATVLRGQNLFEGLDINDVREIHIQSADDEVTLKKPEDQWQVTDRKGFPADSAKVNTTLVKLWATRILQASEVGSSQDGRLNLLEPSEEGDDEKKATKVTLKGADSNEITAVLIGKTSPQQANPQANPMAPPMGSSGRFIRTSNNSGVVLEVPDNFAEDLSKAGWPNSFGIISAEPKGWLSKSQFIAVKKVKSVVVTPKEEGKAGFAVSRDSDTGDFVLSGDIPEGKELDASQLSGLKTVLSNASFEDLLSEEQVKEIDESKVTTVQLTTFEGFTYDITMGPKSEESGNPVPFSFKVTGNFPTERPAPEEEEDEAAKTKADADFQTALQEKKDKLAKEQSLSSQWFTLSNYRVSSLLKSRDELLKDIEKEGEEGDDGKTTRVLEPGEKLTPMIEPAKPSELPPGIVVNEDGKYEAVTPPVAVPPRKDDKKVEVTSPPIEVPAASEAKKDGE